MNVKISILIFILLSFLNIGAISDNICNTKNPLNTLESNVRNISEFEENGVKLQYKTKENIQKETFRIREYLTHNISGYCDNIDKNQFQISNNDYHVDVKIWNEDKYNYVEIILVNRNSKYLILNLTNMLKKIEDEKSEDIQYFSYYEGKNLDSNYSIDEFLNESNLKNTELLKINNGYTGIGYLNNSIKINFALIKYNTGSHIIIGTPIIFTTY